MDWLALTAISVLARSIYGVMTKVLSNKLKVSVFTQATLLPLAGAVIALVLSPFIGGIHFDTQKLSIVALLLVVIGQGLGNIVYFAAIKDLTNSTAQIAFSSILVFNTILSLMFLNLHLTMVNVLGLMLLMLAVTSVATGKIELHKRGVTLMILSAFLFSIFQLSSSEVSRQVSAAAYLLVAYGGAALVVFLIKTKVIIGDIASIKRSQRKLIVGIPLLTALPSVANFLFAYYAYRIAPQPAKVAMLLTSQVVLTVLLSYFFLNEKDHAPRKFAAAVLVVISAILIKS